MVQQGQTIELTRRGPDGERVWAYRFRMGGRGSLAPGVTAIHNGADDNASGTTAILELASRLTREVTPRRSIIFAASSDLLA